MWKEMHARLNSVRKLVADIHPFHLKPGSYLNGNHSLHILQLRFHINVISLIFTSETVAAKVDSLLVALIHWY